METSDKDRSNTEVTIALNVSTKHDDNPSLNKKNVKLLIVINKRMPIISVLHDIENDANSANLLECTSPKTRLLLLAGLIIASMVSAMCFLFGIRFAYLNELDNFFKYEVSVLIYRNKRLGICLATITATLLSAAIFIRHPVIRCTENKVISRNKVLRANLVLLIIGMFACINLILLACIDLSVRPWHFIFAVACFGSFIIYELGHNFCPVSYTHLTLPTKRIV